LTNFFKDNYDKLAPVFLKNKSHDDITPENKEGVMSLHKAFINDMQEKFMGALGKDRMYKRPCGAVTDQQIWMLGVLMIYMVDKVLRFSHKDFLAAIRCDLGPLLGDTGLWMFKNYTTYLAEQGDNERKKMAKVCTDFIEKYLETGFEVLNKENKYNLFNRFGPKKCPDKQVMRSSLQHIYSWTHYAPVQWF